MSRRDIPTPFYVNALRHPRVPSVLGSVAPSLSGGGYPILPKPNKHAGMTNISAVSTRARSARSPVNESTVSTPGVDTSSNIEQHTQAGSVVNKDAELNTKISRRLWTLSSADKPSYGLSKTPLQLLSIDRS
ncbi:unnamed protein product [Phytophthora fragariaefolia]|uniref:Unnamed protein product n=1 Tax=Phytophthora fragariaefolia TaxID=1490495 RepID=A0A9W6YEM4_9STRA|nr:unnamed protein product [Phytophthora fragariaefolia]